MGPEFRHIWRNITGIPHLVPKRTNISPVIHTWSASTEQEREQREQTNEQLEALNVRAKLTTINRNFWRGWGTVSPFEDSCSNNYPFGGRIIGEELSFEVFFAHVARTRREDILNLTKHVYWHLSSWRISIKVGIYHHKDVPSAILAISGGSVIYPPKDYSPGSDPNMGYGRNPRGAIQQKEIQRLYTQVFPILKEIGLPSIRVKNHLGHWGNLGIKSDHPEAEQFLDQALALDNYLRGQELPQKLIESPFIDKKAHNAYLRLVRQGVITP